MPAKTTSPSDVYVGIDNGSTGTIGIYVPSKEKALVFRTPLLEHDVGGTWRLNFEALTAKMFVWLRSIGIDLLTANVQVAIEPPMMAAKRWYSTLINIRLDEAFIQYCEAHSFPWEYMRPQHWQEILGPKDKAAQYLLQHLDTRIGDKVDESDIDGLAIAYVLSQKGTTTDETTGLTLEGPRVLSRDVRRDHPPVNRKRKPARRKKKTRIPAKTPPKVHGRG